MPTVAAIAVKIAREGEPITLVRHALADFGGTTSETVRAISDGAGRTVTDGAGLSVTDGYDGSMSANVQAFVRGYRPDELVNDIEQGDREMRIAPGALAAQGFPDTPSRLDQVLIGDAYATVQSCETRTLRGVPAVHVVQVRGG